MKGMALATSFMAALSMAAMTMTALSSAALSHLPSKVRHRGSGIPVIWRISANPLAKRSRRGSVSGVAEPSDAEPLGSEPGVVGGLRGE